VRKIVSREIKYKSFDCGAPLLLIVISRDEASELDLLLTQLFLVGDLQSRHFQNQVIGALKLVGAGRE
jgi:hypothetical protein